MAIFSTHIGINYAGTQNALRGCINDANDWAAWSHSIGVATPTMLLESQATKTNILSAVDTLCGILRNGDDAIVTFSGHGTQIPDRDADEPDYYDEALCPFDLNRNLLTDDELQHAFAAVPPGAMLWFVSDCCHSATLTRAAIVDSPLPAESPRSISFETLCTEMCLATIDRVHQEARAARTLAKAEINLVHSAGCQDNQSSFDATIGGKACGAFSYYTLAALKARGATALTFAELQAMIRPYLPSNRYPQSPNFSGDLSQVIPGASAPLQPPSTPVVNASTGEGVLTLDGKFYRVVPK